MITENYCDHFRPTGTTYKEGEKKSTYVQTCHADFIPQFSKTLHNEILMLRIHLRKAILAREKLETAWQGTVKEFGLGYRS